MNEVWYLTPTSGAVGHLIARATAQQPREKIETLCGKTYAKRFTVGSKFLRPLRTCGNCTTQLEAHKALAAAEKPYTGNDAEIADLVALVREANDRLDEVSAEVKPIIEQSKARLAILLEQRGENWADDEGYARLVAPSTRTVWDSKRLEKLILDDPATYGWLNEYRSEPPVKGGVTVK